MTSSTESVSRHSPMDSTGGLQRQDTVALTPADKKVPWATVCLVEHELNVFVQLYDNDVTFGGGQEAVVRVHDAAAAAIHCTLRRTPEGVLVQDNSETGTIVDDELVHHGSRRTKVPLTMRIGATELTVNPPTGVSDLYTTKAYLGQGATAAVWKCESCDGKNRTVAVKQVLHHGIGDPRVLAAFANEARTLSRLNDANIVGVEALFLGVSPAIVLEHVAGESLAKAIDRGIPKAQAPAVFRQLLRAIACLHTNQIVHRDVKPANVLLDTHGVVKLVDFGLARDITLGLCMAPAGTPLYRAPEVYDPTGRGYGTSVDVWSSGMVLHEMSVTRHF